MIGDKSIWFPDPARKAALLAAFALLTACAGTPRTMSAPRVQLAALELVEATRDYQRFSVSLRVDNLNEFDVEIDGIEFSARLSGQGLLIGEAAEPVVLPALDVTTLSVEVTTELVSSVRSMLSIVDGPDDALPYELNGVIRLARGMDRRTRFSYSGRVPVTVAAGAAAR